MRDGQRRLLFSCLGALALLYACPSFAGQAALQADTFLYDQQKDIFTAQGRVELEQDGQMVFADRLTYDKPHDEVRAIGNVILVDTTGQTYFAQSLALHNALKTGLVQQIGLVFSDGSRAAAREGEQTAQDQTILRDAVYSPCNLCAEDPHKAPLWQLRAKRVVHDRPTHDMYYHGATMEARGVPVAYLPYFSHPDPSVHARSGFLSPRFSTDSKNGFMLRNYYYQAFSPQQDLTLEVSPTQKSGLLVGSIWRKHFNNGQMLFDGSINRSAVRGGSGDDDIVRDKQWRGHVFSNGLFELSDTWRANYYLQRTWDAYYLRDFDYGEQDILASNFALERFKGRNYTNISTNFFQDLRPGIPTEQPDMLPWITHDMVGRPNAFLGGRWAVDSETITLFREGAQSMSRISTVPSWQRRDILPLGIQTKLDGQLRADGYWIRQGSPYDPLVVSDNVSDRTVGRLFPAAQAEATYPLVRPGTHIDTLIEPQVALTTAPNRSTNKRIPNEDSRDVDVDISNLYAMSRFPGRDRIETGSHVSYGVKAGGYAHNGNSAFATLGQSYRISDNNPFPDNSGLENDRSDLVGKLEATFYNQFYADYNFRLNEEDLESRIHELQASYLQDDLEFRTNYIYARAVEGTAIGSDRQQLGASAAKTFAKNWSVAFDTLHDLSGDSGLLKAGLGLQYKNECLRATLRGERDLTDRLTGGSDSLVLFSLGLRNLGGYDTPLLRNDPLYAPFGAAGKI